MKSGFVLYCAQIQRTAQFYQQVFGLVAEEMDSDFALLTAANFELVLLVTPQSRAASPETTDPSPRESTPIKPTFFVDETLANLTSLIRKNGGIVFDSKSWEFGGRTVCDATDCEGNVFQLRISESRESS